MPLGVRPCRALDAILYEASGIDFLKRVESENRASLSNEADARTGPLCVTVSAKISNSGTKVNVEALEISS